MAPGANSGDRSKIRQCPPTEHRLACRVNGQFRLSRLSVRALMGGSGGTQSPGVSAEKTTSMKPHLLVFGLGGKAELPKTGSGPAPALMDPHQVDTPHQQQLIRYATWQHENPH